ncbi:3-hydroxyacyl-CoA dehydrogenase NAD-binding domain-containing protein [Gordonia rhizosphera]|uniref:Putative 3-hydroxybutyryl-CoA dehydrogenase n=1 Tax=Gordonia rhizosphera NBRC 16068 TaxID=1108045 RepID=K6WYT3_9ACTN|nr:3-hydroxyacyl-CoA dehydrogenase NAD-binding domain-containing protein [Gordonia rhizosphera]GAB91714.1 putative 3-hydroxybutyryl-CoA dehydrogenase [Gordonia rhizosphera NBRC 16068]
MREIKKVAVIGGGLIGMSWASLFLARGLRVVVIDPRAEAESELHTFVDEAWPMLTALELTTTDDVQTPQFGTEIGGLTDVDFVTECGPDRIEVKHAMIGELEAVIDPDVIISSSTSSLLPSDIQSGAKYPERVLVGHPMNPPHMVPMVELVGGRLTSEQTLRDAEEFYVAMKRIPIRVRKEVVGHLANRLTSALYREAVGIVEQGIGSVSDVDTAITYGPGMRWALMGPHLTYHLGGGSGGYRHYLDHLGPTQEARWKELSTPSLTPELKEELIAGVDEELLKQDISTLTERRDQALVKLFQLKKTYGF